MSDYHDIVAHYEACLDAHGDTHRGVDWPSEVDAQRRYRVMLDVIREPGRAVSLLDFGCGASHLYAYIRQNELPNIDYSGLDLSPKFVALCRSKHPERSYFCLDVLQPAAAWPDFDYIVMNGVFTERRSLSFEVMFEYFKALVLAVYPHARRGIAFNVMSKVVDWERDDLFHLPLDPLVAFLSREVSRHLVIRADYGLYEYTVYVYRRPLGEA